MPLQARNAFEDLTEGLSLDRIVAEDYSDYVRQSQLVARELGLSPGQKGLVINGRVKATSMLSKFFIEFYPPARRLIPHR